MKKLLISLILIFLGWSLSAQEDTLSWKQQFQRHDIQIGFGEPLLPSLVTNQIYRFGKPDYYVEQAAVDWFGPDTYTPGRFFTPTFSVGYKYRFAKWFWFGGTISYTGFYQNYFDRVSGKKVATNMTHVICIMPSVRFSWLNKKYVTLYSGLSLGYVMGIDRYKTSDSRYTDVYHGAAFQLTAVGVHVGKQWYGFAEVGLGMLGVFQAGFGYNFNCKKK